MMNANQSIIRPRTVKLLAKFIRPLEDEGVITFQESKEIISQLKHLAKKGRLMPPITPRLIDQRTAGEMLGISLASFKAHERAGLFPFPRKMVGSSVRYRNLDVLDYLLTDDVDEP